MQYEKVYVEIVVKFALDGQIRPLFINWRDGERFYIDRLKRIEKAPARAGSLITRRYTVLINGLERYLYYELNTERWFVERKI